MSLALWKPIVVLYEPKNIPKSQIPSMNFVFLIIFYRNNLRNPFVVHI